MFRRRERWRRGSPPVPREWREPPATRSQQGETSVTSDRLVDRSRSPVESISAPSSAPLPCTRPPTGAGAARCPPRLEDRCSSAPRQPSARLPPVVQDVRHGERAPPTRSHHHFPSAIRRRCTSTSSQPPGIEVAATGRKVQLTIRDLGPPQVVPVVGASGFRCIPGPMSMPRWSKNCT